MNPELAKVFFSIFAEPPEVKLEDEWTLKVGPMTIRHEMIQDKGVFVLTVSVPVRCYPDEQDFMDEAELARETGYMQIITRAVSEYARNLVSRLAIQQYNSSK